MRWIRYGIGGLFGLVVLLFAAGALYQFIGDAIDKRRYTPPGKLVDVGGHRLHIYCTGVGSPTVILDGGSGAGAQWSLHWINVQPEIAKFTRVCSYDRAGYGWSDSGPTPRTAQQVATELHTLLANAQISSPYVLVGHSFSGFTVRLFSDQHPSEVVGIVLIDAGHEDAWKNEEQRKLHDRFARQLPTLRVAVTLGTLRLMAASNSLPPDAEKGMQKFPFDVRPMILAGILRTSWMTTVLQEDVALQETQQELRSVHTLDNLPLVVVTATSPTKYSNLPAGIDSLQIKENWLKLQQKLTALSTNSTQVFADRSGHDIHLDQPEIVVDAVRKIVEATSTK